MKQRPTPDRADDAAPLGTSPKVKLLTTSPSFRSSPSSVAVSTGESPSSAIVACTRYSPIFGSPRPNGRQSRRSRRSRDCRSRLKIRRPDLKLTAMTAMAAVDPSAAGRSGYVMTATFSLLDPSLGFWTQAIKGEAR